MSISYSDIRLIEPLFDSWFDALKEKNKQKKIENMIAAVNGGGYSFETSEKIRLEILKALEIRT